MGSGWVARRHVADEKTPRGPGRHEPGCRQSIRDPCVPSGHGAHGRGDLPDRDADVTGHDPLDEMGHECLLSQPLVAHFPSPSLTARLFHHNQYPRKQASITRQRHGHRVQAEPLGAEHAHPRQRRLLRRDGHRGTVHVGETEVALANLCSAGWCARPTLSMASKKVREDRLLLSLLTAP